MTTHPHGTDPFHPDLAPTPPHHARVHLVRGSELSADTAQTSGMSRREAVSGRTVGSSKLWTGETHVAPATNSGDHHHGEAETSIYVVSGRPRFVFHDGTGEVVLQTEPGDYVFVPPWVPHRENPDPRCRPSWSSPAARRRDRREPALAHPAHRPGDHPVTRRPLLALPALLAALALLLTGCSGAADDGPVDLSQVTLRVGDQAGIQQALLDASGALDGAPYRVEWAQFRRPRRCWRRCAARRSTSASPATHPP